MKIWKIDIGFGFKWFDFYFGLYWDRHKKVLYVVPFPMFVFSFERYKEIVLIELNIDAIIPIDEVEITLKFDEEKENEN